MTDKHAEALADDIAYMRTLAAEGVQAPLLGGRFSLMWGVLVACATFAEWLILSDRVAWGANRIGLIWLAIGVLGSALSALLARSMRGKPGFGSVGNRVSKTVWSIGGLAIFIYVMGIVIAAMTGRGLASDFDTIMPMAFCVYGIAYFTTGSLAGNGAMKAVAGLSFLATLATAALLHQPVAYLAASAFVVLTAVLPGIWMMRHEPAALV